jgi:hypothetical protein
MIANRPKNRPSCDMILNDILFWRKFKICNFLRAIGPMWRNIKRQNFCDEFFFNADIVELIDLIHDLEIKVKGCSLITFAQHLAKKVSFADKN